MALHILGKFAILFSIKECIVHSVQYTEIVVRYSLIVIRWSLRIPVFALRATTDTPWAGLKETVNGK